MAQAHGQGAGHGDDQVEGELLVPLGNLVELLARQHIDFGRGMGDGIIAALQIMAEMENSGKSLHELKSGMQKYPQILINIKTTKKISINTNEYIQRSVRAVEQQLGDTGRVLLRASGTEPLIRVMVEGEHDELARNCANQLADDVRKAMDA